MRLLRVPLVQRESLGAGYFLLHFELGDEPPLQTQAGHFAMVRCEDWGQAPLLARPMSLVTGGDRPSILIKVVGEGTGRMASDPIGANYTLLAPLGQPWAPAENVSRVILVAGGVGVAPLVFLARQLAQRAAAEQRAIEVVTIYGGRTQHDLPLASALESSSTLYVTTEDGSRGMKGRVTDRLALLLLEQASANAEVPDGSQRGSKIYTCGPHAMMAAVAAMAARAGVACDASLEAPMGCGYGVCLGCPAARVDGSYLYTCVDGPCVDAATVDWSRGVF